MANAETNPEKNNPDASEYSISRSTSDSLAQNLKSQWGAWVLDVSKNLLPIFKETIIFAVFILGDLFIVWLAGFAFVDIIHKIPFFEWLYNGIKIASVVVITIHYVCQCIIEIRKNGELLMSKVFPKNDKKKEENV